jgi:hypothetical protein
MFDNEWFFLKSKIFFGEKCHIDDDVTFELQIAPKAHGIQKGSIHHI